MHGRWHRATGGIFRRYSEVNRRSRRTNASTVSTGASPIGPAVTRTHLSGGRLIQTNLSETNLRIFRALDLHGCPQINELET